MRYEDITGRIIKCAMNAHVVLGNGFHEVISRNLDLLE